MALMLGIDTGGTFTDAVLVDDAPGNAIVAWAKAPTTHHDLAIGVAASVESVLDRVGHDRASSIGLVSVSTTLATNALVEGHGEPAALFTFGFSPAELARTGVGSAVAPQLLAQLTGGHDAHGNESSPIDEHAIIEQASSLAEHAQVSAFAVAGQFSVRNPAHEIRAAELIRSATGLPVTTSHELSAKLDGPRRALTAVLNARLLGTIARLNAAVATVLAANKIDAPMMVVRGDGSLVSAAFAGARPIETILSGPAASVIGALHLAGLCDGLVIDIGGTTTDVALISAGRPSITDGGAVVGSHRTMVEAVDMATTGLGGDSQVRIDTKAAAGPVLLGPERAIPVCRLAVDYPALHDVLDRQLAASMSLTTHGRFLVATAPAEVMVSDRREAAVLARLTDGPVSVDDATQSALEQRAAARLQARGLVRVATMTPTDASAIVNSVPDVDVLAATKVATILARQTGTTGGPIAPSATDLAELVISILVRRSADFALRVALGADDIDHCGAGALLAASLDGHRNAAAVQISLTSPLTAIGAPASAYYAGVASRVGTTSIVPEYAHVANAVGAVIGQVRVRRSATITQPTRGQYRVHLHDQPTFGSVEVARKAAAELLRDAARSDALSAGAASPELTEDWQQRVAHVNGKDVFVEGTLTIEAAGRPRF